MWCQQTKSGKYQFFERYKDPYTKKYKVISLTMPRNTSYTRRRAYDILSQRIKLVKQEAKFGKDLKLWDLAQYYNQWKYENCKKQTAIGHESKINRICLMLGDVYVQDITAAYYREKMGFEPPTTYNERLMKFKAMMRWAYKNDLVDDIHFIDKIQRKKDRPTRIKVEDKYLEREELIKLINGMPEHWAIITEFLALTGMRIAELIDLKKSNVDAKNRIIHIRSTYALLTRESSSTKTETSERDIYIQAELMPLIKQIRSIPNKTPYFISGTDHGRISYDAYRKALKEYSLKLLGRKITPHVLRHTHTSLLAEQGFALEKISRRLGHSDSRITKAVYLHVTKKAIQIENEQLDHIKLL